jgi:hypothetical protein
MENLQKTLADFLVRYMPYMSVNLARQLTGDNGVGGDEVLLKAVIQESYGVDTGRSLAKQIAEDLLTAEAAATATAEQARRIPIDERYYRPRLEPWLPGEYIPRPYYDEDETIAQIDRGIDEQRLLGRPISWCPVTGDPFKW